MAVLTFRLKLLAERSVAGGLVYKRKAAFRGSSYVEISYHKRRKREVLRLVHEVLPLSL